MGAKRFLPKFEACTAFTDAILRSLAELKTYHDLKLLMEAVAHEMGFRYYALIHHDDLRGDPPGRIHLKHYPAAAAERIIDQGQWRRDPIIRGCAFAGRAFLWSELGSIIKLGRFDRECLSAGEREGLNEGITVPFSVLGECTGSCTFAGTSRPERTDYVLGVAQLIGVFAFQAARRISPATAIQSMGQFRLHPRPRDCVVLAGRGLSNKEIARSLGLTPRTVDGYLTEARRLFDAHDRTELVVSAILAGEVGLYELRRCQPE